MKTYYCWKCGAELPPFERGKVPYRATCERCSSYLHACVNCKNYCPGKPNDCLVPGTEYVPDRQHLNYCDSFELKGEKGDGPKPSNDPFSKLFKD